MLTFFPAPYPDEWWYSVLCRYYVRSGFQKHETVRQELYGGKKLQFGRLFPSTDCATLLEGIPTGILDIKDVLLRHTLAPYYLRMYPLVKKRAMLTALMSKRNVTITSIEIKTLEGAQALKYCPVCYPEDAAKYGEPYWHREHQIPLMPLCPKHHCRLELFDIGAWSRLSERFHPLSAVSPTEPNSSCEGWEKRLSAILSAYLEYPFEAGPTPGYNNLLDELLAQGYGLHAIRQKSVLSTQKLYDACAELFPASIMAQYFPKPAPTVFHRIGSWKLTGPERYALLSTIADLPPETLFGSRIQREDALAARMLSLRDSGVVYPKWQLAESLGIEPAQIDSLARKHHIAPFWKQTNKTKPIKRTCSLRLNLTPDEEQHVQDAARRHGNGQTAVFARALLLKAIDALDKE